MSEYLVTSMMLFVVYLVIHLLAIPVDKKMFLEFEMYYGFSIPKNKYRHIYSLVLSGVVSMIPYIRVGLVVFSILMLAALNINPIRRLIITGFTTSQIECRS